MSVGFIRSNVARKVISVVCLLTFPAVAQQANTGLTMQATPVAGQQPSAPAANDSQQSATPAPGAGQQPSAPVSSAPEPKNLPRPTGEDYSKPTSLLPNPFARYIPRDVPPPSFTNAPKIEQLIQNGKLMLSLNDAIAIALADNLDIAVQRYNLPIADTDILRTKAGQSFLGINSGVVQNTPGGGVGGV